MLNGIIVIDKDSGMTSADVIYHLRKVLHIRKMGHAGTLDPEVTGVLPIAVGQATKLIELMHTKSKEYVGTGLFGLATDSYDLTGKVKARCKLEKAIGSEKIQQAMMALTGAITQKPPIYSAVRVNGKHLYEYARQGIAVDRPSRKVEVYDYQQTAAPVFFKDQGQEEFYFKIRCSKGTYVRSLVNDLGVELGCPAVMKSLRRTASSGFSQQQAVKLATIEHDPAAVRKYIRPIDDFFADLHKLDLTQSSWFKVKNGASIQLENDEKLLALSYNKKVKAIYQRSGEQYKPFLMLLANE